MIYNIVSLLDEKSPAGFMILCFFSPEVHIIPHKTFDSLIVENSARFESELHPTVVDILSLGSSLPQFFYFISGLAVE